VSWYTDIILNDDILNDDILNDDILNGDISAHDIKPVVIAFPNVKSPVFRKSYVNLKVFIV